MRNVLFRPSTECKTSTFILRDFYVSLLRAISSTSPHAHIIHGLLHFLPKMLPCGTFFHRPFASPFHHLFIELCLPFLPSCVRLRPFSISTKYHPYSVLSISDSSLSLPYTSPPLLLNYSLHHRHVPEVSGSLRAEFARGDGRVKKKVRTVFIVSCDYVESWAYALCMHILLR
jgi:hypothetical protein